MKAESYKSRNCYIVSRAGRTITAGKESLCNVLAALAEASDGRPIPWVTPVLGSGAVSDDQTRRIAERRAESAAVAVGKAQSSADSRIVSVFTRSLIDDRLSLSSLLSAEDGVEGGLGDRALERDSAAAGERTELVVEGGSGDRALERGQCLLAVALLTQAYHLMRGYSLAPVPRRHAGRAVLGRRPGRDQGQWDPESFDTDVLEEAYGALSRAHILTKRAARDSHEAVGAAEVMMRSMEDLRPARNTSPSISLLNVELLTEYAWYLVAESPSYPGWWDLLWSLFMMGHGWPPPKEGGTGPRPITVNLDSAVESVRERFEDKAATAWSESVEGSRTAPKVYQEVAELLWAQSQACTGWEKETTQPPVAAAFVTTFDLELEMALLLRQRQFVVALPVTYTTDAGVSADTWIGYLVEDLGEPNSLEAILRPERWFILSNRVAYESEKSLRKLPTVVRLTGLPLIELPPDLPDRLGGGFESLLSLSQLRGQRVVDIRHAVLLDEGAGLTRSVLAMSGLKGTTGEYVPGLPPSLIGSRNERFNRFWMMLGVQTGDAAIRQTIASHVVGRAEKPKGQQSVLEPRGVAINQRISGEAEDVMHWAGLDVVRASCEEFECDIAHYSSAHLTYGGVRALPEPPGTDCRDLVTGGRA